MLTLIGTALTLEGAEIWRETRPELFFALAAISTGLGLCSLVVAIGYYREFTRVWNATTATSLGSLPSGRMELKGTVSVASESLPHPTKNGDCVYATWKIEAGAAPESCRK